MKAVVLAAGLGTRMGKLTEETPKGLLKVAGREIIYRSLKTLENLGVEEFVVITNPKYKKKYEEFLKKEGFNYKIVLNNNPERGNGYSLYLAKGHVNDKFVLVMSDHIYEEGFLKEAIKKEGLIIDKEGKFIDINEATKVLVENGRVKDIGKKLERWHGFDTGLFILTPEIFKYAEEVAKEKELVELSEIVKRAKLKVSEVNGYFWMDVDTEEEMKIAKRLIIQNAIKGSGDGFISRKINRKISTKVSEFLVDYLTPNQITILTFLFGLFSAVVALFNIPLGGILYQISSILDGVDGEIARASMRTSKFGGYVDSILDRYVDFAFLLALAYVIKPSLELWVIIALAIFGSAMVSYSTERYKAAYFKDIYKEIPKMRYLIGKRDERIFVIMIFCLINKIPELFILLAIITNVRVLLTMYLVWRKENKVAQ
ncbi:bifunctional L-myo-inositol-1-phosphate cytidylyltransferase/CDP-L-myo-inositol myo-inositolphosphotransferase [Methanotorris igneus]|uniref:Bifunctional IPC transferase and DIPP synthase n=1 Tax=Methanotorris igneus (strain DSM 5666 / JCM 11834 / Kol 5) TaxID=880724 RepID=F6BCB3_METIK|nr:CDP-alcohol phosphatidyltransferase [Methanotorris igneus Kol 5]